MPQEFNVLCCCECSIFQVHQVKKANKWACKVCGVKQSVKKIYGVGSSSDCRAHVQKLNMMGNQEVPDTNIGITSEAGSDEVESYPALFASAEYVLDHEDNSEEENSCTSISGNFDTEETVVIDSECNSPATQNYEERRSHVLKLLDECDENSDDDMQQTTRNIGYKASSFSKSHQNSSSALMPQRQGFSNVHERDSTNGFSNDEIPSFSNTRSNFGIDDIDTDYLL